MTERERFEKWMDEKIFNIACFASFDRAIIRKGLLFQYDKQQKDIDTLTTSRDNAVSMLKTVLQMLDSKTCL